VQILRDQYQVDHSGGLRSSSLWWKRSRDVDWGRALVRGRPRFRSLIIAFGSRFRRQAHLISIGSTKAMDDIIQFEGAARLPNLDSIGGRVARAIAEPTLPAR